MAGGLDRTLKRHDDGISHWDWLGVCQVLCNSLASDGETIAVYHVVVQQVAHHSGRASVFLEVLHHIFAGWLQVGQERGLVRDTLEVGKGDVDIDGPGHCDQMQYGIGAASEYHHNGDGVLECLLRHDVSRLQVQL